MRFAEYSISPTIYTIHLPADIVYFTPNIRAVKAEEKYGVPEGVEII
jgi:hypothetical protein